MGTDRAGGDSTPRAGEGGAYRKTPTQLATDPAFTGTYVQRQSGGTSIAAAPLHVFNVRDYGATGDGSTNDTAAIQAAINAAAAAGGGVVFLTGGIYRHSTLNLKSYVTLQGSGRGTILRLRSGVNAHCIQLADARQEQVAIRDLVIDGNSFGQSAGSWHGIYIVNDSGTNGAFASGLLNAHHFIDNLVIKNCKGDGVHFDGDSFGGECHISNIFAYNCDGYGFYTLTPDSFWDRCSAGQSGLQGFFIAAPNSRFVNCKAWFSGRITNNLGDGFIVSNVNRAELNNCEAQDNQRHGFNLSFANNCTLSGCVADSNGTIAGGGGAGFSLTSSTLNRVTGVTYDRNGTPLQSYGVQLPSSTGNILDIVCGAISGTLINGAVGDNVVSLQRTSGSFSKTGMRGVTGTSAPSAGAAGALPATPAGYLTVTINGTDRQIPYY